MASGSASLRHFEFDTYGIVDAPADSLWAVIRDFGATGIKEVTPTKFEGPGTCVGAKREIEPPGLGVVFKEQLMSFSETDRTFSFTISNPGFVNHYFTWQVIALGMGEGAGEKCILRFKGAADMDMSAVPEESRGPIEAFVSGAPLDAFRGLLEANAKRVAAGE